MVSKARRLSATLLIIALALVTLTIFLPTPVKADGTGDSGVSYKVSDDGTYVIITGYDEQFPNLSIESEIDGLPVKEIAESAFQNCVDIYSVTIPDSVERIGEKAFRDCPNLVSVKLSASLKAIPFEAFRDCRLLTSVTLPDGLERIESFAFQGTGIRKMKIPASVNYIGHDVFMLCENIRLDVSENALAADYAERYSVNTEFRGTTLYFMLMMILGSAVAIAVGLVIVALLRRYFAKHPTHNPFIYVRRAFGALKRYIVILFGKLKALLVRFFGVCKELIGKIRKNK